MNQADAAQLIAGAIDAAGLGPQAAEPMNLGESGDVVARMGGLYLKIARHGDTDRVGELDHEITALRWLAGKVTVPEVIWSGDIEGGRVLVSAALPGTPVSHAPAAEAQAALAATLDALAALHGLPAAGCPFDASVDAKLTLAARRAALGLIDTEDFDDERLGWTAEQALAEAGRTAPRDERLVVTHGDASLPNFIWSPAGGVGLIDLGRFGLADPYQDLALFLRSAARNHPGVDAAGLVRARYPLTTLDTARCDFYRLLDELF
jgi:aminoglycoside 3'-phosphotransferase-2